LEKYGDKQALPCLSLDKNKCTYAQCGCTVTPDPTTGAVIIPTDWHTIERNAFYRCDTIKSVVIPKNIRYVYTSAFWGSSLEEIVFEDGSQLELIGHNSFAETKIAKINIPASVIKIGFAFGGSSLEEVVFEAGSQLQTLGYEAFKDTKLTTINIPADVEVGECVFEDTPCDDITIFQPGKNVVDCKTQPA